MDWKEVEKFFMEESKNNAYKTLTKIQSLQGWLIYSMALSIRIEKGDDEAKEFIQKHHDKMSEVLIGHVLNVDLSDVEARYNQAKKEEEEQKKKKSFFSGILF
jgi:hypothetical protein